MKSIFWNFLIVSALFCSCSDDKIGSDDNTNNNEQTGDENNVQDEDKVTNRQLYISPNGADSNNGLSSAFPFKTFSKVLEMLKPGDIVNIMPGEYVADKAPVLDLLPAHSGDPDNYITFKAYSETDRPVIIGKGVGVWNTININASYIIIDGLEVKGGNAELNENEAYQNAVGHRDGTITDWNNTAKFNTNGISIGGTRMSTKNPTHITVKNCIVHDFPGGGIGSAQADYVTIDGNTVYNNAWFTMYACSGISVIQPINSDDNTGYKIVIKNNICYDNHTKIPWYTTSDFRRSDGNGIIVDINQYPDAEGPNTSGGAYRGRTLVANNLSFFNGGSGIHSFKADHVDIINNTAYWNSKMYTEDDNDNNIKYKDTYADIFSNQCHDVNIVNNIMYSMDGGCCNLKASEPDVRFENNLYFNGRFFEDETDTGNIEGNPNFVNPSTDFNVADFHLQAGTPAAGMGVNKDYMPDTDREGNLRDRSSIDVGCYVLK